MTQNPPISRRDPAVTSLATARFGMRSSSGSGAMLAVGGLVVPDTDGLVLPIALVALAVFVLVAAAIVVAIARRRLSRGPSAEGGEADSAGPGTMEALSGRDRNLPRWLDPSVAAARFRTDAATAIRALGPATPVSERPPVVFAQPLDELTDRVQVRYDGVPLLDRPDDVLGRTLAELDSGDEVEVAERAEIWARVRTPSGASGWLPTMTLAALATVVIDPEVDAAEPEDPGPATAVDAAPPLEALLEAIVAQRQVHPSRVADPGRAAGPLVDAEPLTATRTRTRTRKPRLDRAADPRLVAQEPAEPIEPAAGAPDSERVPAAAKRPRSRAVAGERRTTRPR